MKRISLLVALFTLLTITAKAQLKVTGFELLPNDLSGRTKADEKAIVDMDGETCALIKVMTVGMSKMQRDNLKFSAGSLATYIAKTDYSNDRFIKVYVGPNKGTLIIYHESFGEVRYSLPTELKSQTTYKLELELETVSLKIIVTPEDAEVHVDGELTEIRNGVVLMEVSSGSEHTIDVSCDYYRPDKKVVTADSNTEVKIDLLPFYGYLSVNTIPDEATIYINDKEANTKTPYLSNMMESGEYRVRVVKDNYVIVNKIVTIGEGKTTELNLTLSEKFARPTITTSYEAEIWVNGEKKGVGEWTGTLSAGDYTVEARKAGCRTVRKNVTMVNGEKPLISLEAPKPMLGSINIKSNPSGAIITLNNIQKGVTPTTLNDISVGEYNVVLSKDGYGTAMQTVTVIENQTVNVNLTLVNGRNITINSEPAGANVYIDGTYLGTTPLTKQIAFGSHNLKVSLDGEEKNEAINVSEGGKSSWSFDVRKKPKGSYNVNGVTFEMVSVEGGTFNMASDYKVTLSDYMIGKYEVTQELWQAVMGSNPSYFKGNNLPVERVSWNDIQEFITKLNQKTGQRFRLPTEAEWEYAARGGNKSNGYEYSGSNTIGNVAWYGDNSGSKTHPVGQKSPNELGIYDMSGNVWEWCQDWYGSYSSSSQTNPTGPSSGSYRVLRGGCWFNDAGCCRVSDRSYFTPGYRDSYFGFRVSLVP